MSLYKDFAYFYSKGEYVNFGKSKAEYFPEILELFNKKAKTVLDIACGEGNFAILLSKKRYKVTGADISKEMLKIAKANNLKEKAKVKFILKDMRELDFREEFDLVTCWFDSMNYLLNTKDLMKVFKGVYKALKSKGLFIFDVNTIFGLAVNWQKRTCYIQQDTEELFEIHRPLFDYENNIATLKITGFRKKGELWEKMEEVHKEKGFSIEEIRDCFKKTEFKELACFESLKTKEELKAESWKAYFIVEKKK